MDETNKPLIDGVRPAQGCRRGRVARYDVEYARHGTANVLLASEPLAGKRQVRVTDTRKRRDWAQFMKEVLAGPYARHKRGACDGSVEYALDRQFLRSVFT